MVGRTNPVLSTVRVERGNATPVPVRDPGLPLSTPVTAMSAAAGERGIITAQTRILAEAKDALFDVRRDHDFWESTVTAWKATQRGSRGWGNMTALVDPVNPYGGMYPQAGLYALDRRGVVYRYEYLSTGALGRRTQLTGIPLLKTLTLHSSAENRDILLGTSRSGGLTEVVVTGGNQVSVRAANLRNRGWDTYDRIALTECGKLLAVQSANKRAAVYDLGSLRGWRTTIGYLGWSHGPWRDWTVAPHLVGW